MLMEGVLEGTVVEGASQGEDGVAGFPVPPGTGALESNVADEAMGRFDGDRSEGIAALAMAAAVDLMQALLQVPQGRCRWLPGPRPRRAACAAAPRPHQRRHRRTAVPCSPPACARLGPDCRRTGRWQPRADSCCSDSSPGPGAPLDTAPAPTSRSTGPHRRWRTCSSGINPASLTLPRAAPKACSSPTWCQEISCTTRSLSTR